MLAAPAHPALSPSEMQLLLSRTGLTLNPGQVADLVLAWRQLAGLIAQIPQDRALTDDLAYAFRLPPPAEPTLSPTAGKARALVKRVALSAPPAAKGKGKTREPVGSRAAKAPKQSIRRKR